MFNNLTIIVQKTVPLQTFSDQLMEPHNGKDEKQNQTKQYLKYSGLGFQMIAVLLLALWAGQALDEKMEMKNPVWTVVLLLLGLFGSLYLVIKGVSKN